jgi:hypothetical protein
LEPRTSRICRGSGQPTVQYLSASTTYGFKVSARDAYVNTTQSDVWKELRVNGNVAGESTTIGVRLDDRLLPS